MGLLDLIFPKTCLECHREGKYLCSDCVAKVLPAKLLCPECMKPSIDGVTHVKCRKKYGLDGLISIWEYQGIIRKAILALKFKYSTEAGRELTNVFIESLQKLDSRFMILGSTALVPVPLHWHRENVRGFNQSIEVGKLVSAAMNWKFIPDLLIKKQQTVSQVELGGEKRRQNLKNVFVVNSNYQGSDWPSSAYVLTSNSSVLIFDDVFTTGSTLREAAKVLKQAGVKKVWGLTIAR